MAAKNNIRSIRFSDELAELIDRQQGSSFTQKFENLITRCVWELPAKEQELEELERSIKEKRTQLWEMSARARELSAAINDLFSKASALDNAISKAIEKWEKYPKLVQIEGAGGLDVEFVRRGFGKAAGADKITVDEVIEFPARDGNAHGYPLVFVAVVREIRSHILGGRPAVFFFCTMLYGP